MGVQMLHVLRREARLRQRGPHAARGAVTIFGARGDVVRVGRRAVTHQLGQRLGAACQRMLQRLDHQHARALAHHKAVALRIERARCLLGRVVERGAQRLGRCKAAQAHAVDGGLAATTHSDVGFAAADQARGIANRLHAGGACGDRRAQRPLEAMANRHLPCRQIDQERRHGERRQPLRPGRFGGAHGVGNRTKAANARGDDGGRACARRLITAHHRPPRLGQRLVGSAQRKGDEAVHLALVLGRDDGIHIPAALGIFGQGQHPPGHLGGHAFGHGLGQHGDARAARQQPLPGQLDIAPQG